MYTLELKKVQIKPFKGTFYRPVFDTTSNNAVFDHLCRDIISDNDRPESVVRKSELSYLGLMAMIHNVNIVIEGEKDE